MPSSDSADLDRTCDTVIVGGGPCGMVLGLILARAGVSTVVVEKHADFFRDFRGDTIHPSTQEVLRQLGLLDDLLALPHTDMARVTFGWRGEREVVIADLSRLPTQRRAVTFLPQWDFLDLLARAAERLPTFTLLRSTRFEALLQEGDATVGIAAVGPDGPVNIHARLVVAADGRDSDVRAAARLEPREFASPMDVLWFRVPRHRDEHHALMESGAGMLIAIDRGDYYQLAHVITAGGWQASQTDLADLRSRVSSIAPAFADRMTAVGLDDIKVLRVRMDRLRRWASPGLLFLGDAAHAMSPAGGIGINIAIQDAVAAANLLAPVLRERTPTLRELTRVQRRRAPAAISTQWVQRRVQYALLATGPGRPMPLPVRLLDRLPPLRHVVGRFIGMGLRPERVTVASPVPG